MRPLGPCVLALLVGLALAAAGCGSGGGGIPDSKIIVALDLKHTARGYEMGGDPFCTIEDLLNDGDQVSRADDNAGKSGFVIASPNGEIGVLAQRPFAPDCSQRAEHALKKLSRRSG
jgi:hypothetical protein